MASLLKNTMDLSFESYDGAPFGGCMLDDQFNMHLEHDVCGDVINEAGFGPVDVNKFAPGSVVCKVTTVAEPTAELFDHWAGHGPLQLFDGLHVPDFDIESFVGGSGVQVVNLKQELHEPLFDTFSAAVPVAPLFSSLKDVSSGSSPTCSGPNTLKNVPSGLPNSDIQQSLKDVSSPASPDSGMSSAGSPQSIYSDESFIGTQDSFVGSPEAYAEILDMYEEPPVLHVVSPPSSASQPCLKPENENELQCVTLPTVSSDDIAFLESLWGDGELPVESVKPAPTLGSESVLTAVVIQDSPVQPIASPKPVRTPCKPVKTKALTLCEKKERKRAQNKNAATRYREKKRTEAQVIYEDQTKLEEKNKGLHDKVTLISREIQYMKELLIEVYKTKGLIE